MPLYPAVAAPALLVPPAVSGTPPGAAVWPASNRALFARFALLVPTAFRYLNWIVSVQSGNVQVGVVRLAGAGRVDYTRVMNSTVISCPAAADIRTDLGLTTLDAGDYAAFIWADNTTFQTRLLASTGNSVARACALHSSLVSGVAGTGTLTFSGAAHVPLVSLEGDV